MGIYDIDSSTTSDLTNSIISPSYNYKDTENFSYVADWAKWRGIYEERPELQIIIDKMAIWCLGQGIRAKDKNKQEEISKIKGNGKQTTRDIGLNLMTSSEICGDSYAEIIKDKAGRLKNLLIRNSGSIEQIVNNKGILTGYNQIYWTTGKTGEKVKNIVPNENGKTPTWKTDEIFHLSWKPIGDETHSIGVAEKLKDTIDKLKEAEDIMQIWYRRQVYPLRIIEADTDDPTEMTNIKTKHDNAVKNSESIVVPKDTVKVIDNAQKVGSVEDFLTWQYYLIKKFILSEGVPEVILGSVTETSTEGASKILLFAFSQVVKSRQRWFEEQWKTQIGFEINLPEPPSIDPTIMEDTRKAGTLDAAGGPNSMRGKQNLDISGKEK